MNNKDPLALSGATSVFRGTQTKRGLHMRLAFRLRADEHGTPLNAMQN